MVAITDYRACCTGFILYGFEYGSRKKICLDAISEAIIDKSRNYEFRTGTMLTAISTNSMSQEKEYLREIGFASGEEVQKGGGGHRARHPETGGLTIHYISIPDAIAWAERYKQDNAPAPVQRRFGGDNLAAAPAAVPGPRDDRPIFPQACFDNLRGMEDLLSEVVRESVGLHNLRPRMPLRAVLGRFGLTELSQDQYNHIRIQPTWIEFTRIVRHYQRALNVRVQ